jgi:hypothetical protein
MSADIPDEQETNVWLNAGDHEVGQRLRDLVDITCDGNQERANAMLRSRKGREGHLHLMDMSALQERGSGRLALPSPQEMEPHRPMVSITVLPPTTPTPEGPFTNSRPGVSESTPRPAEGRMEQASMVRFR